MNVATISMANRTARRAYIEYRDAVRGSRPASDADMALMRSYRALSQGKRVLNLYDVMRFAGVDERNRPRLAVARADMTHVQFSWIYRKESGDVPVFGHPWRSWHKRARERIVLPGNTFPFAGRNFHATAIVPSIPPRLRPQFHLRNYHLLWEADWTVPPRDPILLKRIHGLLFSVVAQWDLTKLERSVLGLVRATE